MTQTKHPLSIRKLAVSSTTVSRPSEMKFLQGVDVSNIFVGSNGKLRIDILGHVPGYAGSEYENITANLQGSGVAAYYEVFNNHSSGFPYVKFDGEKFIQIQQGSFSNTIGAEEFTFYINPQNVRVSYQKLVNEIRTRSGWEIQHWGDQLTEITVEGHTGGMHKMGDVPGSLVPITENDSIFNSYAYKKLVQLRTLYLEDHNLRNREDSFLLQLSYAEGLYTGYFTNFTGPTANAEKPFVVDYSFTFKVTESASIPGLYQLQEEPRKIRTVEA